MNWIVIREWTSFVSDICQILVFVFGVRFITTSRVWKEYWESLWIEHRIADTPVVNWRETRGEQAYYQFIRLLFLHKREDKKRRMDLIKEEQKRRRDEKSRKRNEQLNK